VAAGTDDIGPLVEQIDTALRTRGSPERAEHEKGYLKSELEHYGTSVPAIRSVAARTDQDASPPLGCSSTRSEPGYSPPGARSPTSTR